MKLDNKNYAQSENLEKDNLEKDKDWGKNLNLPPIFIGVVGVIVAIIIIVAIIAGGNGKPTAPVAYTQGDYDIGVYHPGEQQRGQGVLGAADADAPLLIEGKEISQIPLRAGEYTSSVITVYPNKPIVLEVWDYATVDGDVIIINGVTVPIVATPKQFVLPPITGQPGQMVPCINLYIHGGIKGNGEQGGVTPAFRSSTGSITRVYFFCTHAKGVYIPCLIK